MYVFHLRIKNVITSLLQRDFVLTSATRIPMMFLFKVAAREKNRELDVISSYQTSGYLQNTQKNNTIRVEKIFGNPFNFDEFGLHKILSALHTDWFFPDGLSEYVIGFCRKMVLFALSNRNNFFTFGKIIPH